MSFQLIILLNTKIQTDKSVFLEFQGLARGALRWLCPRKASATPHNYVMYSENFKRYIELLNSSSEKFSEKFQKIILKIVKKFELSFTR
jgi:hypothetical protein